MDRRYKVTDGVIETEPIQVSLETVQAERVEAAENLARANAARSKFIRESDETIAHLESLIQNLDEVIAEIR